MKLAKKEKINWSIVSLEHVRQACENYDSGSIKHKSSSKNTFLLFNNRSYPAKAIRGEALRLATGYEADPNSEFSGGDETERFFAKLGLKIERTARPKLTLISNPNPLVTARSPRHTDSCSDCKNVIYELLRQFYGPIKIGQQTKIDTRLENYRGKSYYKELRDIYHALSEYRGHKEFVKRGSSDPSDIFVPSARFYVELDEGQHFTAARTIALNHYPSSFQFGYDKEKWVSLSDSRNRSDSDKAYRDEQRAWYDTLRDYLPLIQGGQLSSTVRIDMAGLQWCKLDRESATRELQKLLKVKTKVKEVPAGRIGNVALVSHDYTKYNKEGRWDFSNEFETINQYCDGQGCDTILYALYTWDNASKHRKNAQAMFGTLKHVNRIILETGNLNKKKDELRLEIWERGSDEPKVIFQKFATSTAPKAAKKAVIADLKNRNIANATILICGESNLLHWERNRKRMLDPYGVLPEIQRQSADIILNPIHDYMTRYEMRKKRAHFSKGGRTVLSVWNMGKEKAHESEIPWTVFFDGKDCTTDVNAVSETVVKTRPDLRIGILDVTRLKK